MATILACVSLYALFLTVFVIAWARWHSEQDIRAHYAAQQQWRDKLHAKHGRKYGH